MTDTSWDMYSRPGVYITGQRGNALSARCMSCLYSHTTIVPDRDRVPLGLTILCMTAK